MKTGSILLYGVDISKFPVHTISKMGIKRYFNNREFYSMRIKDILRLVYDKFETNKLLNIFGYNENQISGKLSGGEKTLLYLLMSIKNSKFILLDEPFNNLDKNRIELIKNFIYHMKKLNKGILIIDHQNNVSFDKEIKIEKPETISFNANFEKLDFII